MSIKTISFWLAASVSALSLATAAGAQQPERIHVPGRILLPESLTSSADGAVYVGSIAEGAVYKAAPGASEAELWIPGRTAGLLGVFGVFADEASGTLWVCSGSPPFLPPSAGVPAGASALHAFDLVTGAPKASYQLPGEGGFCNDAAVGPDGSVYATDTNGMLVVRLAPGASELEVWSPEGAFGPAGGVLDGIAVVGGRVVVNTLATSKVFAVDIAADGSAGAATEIALSREIVQPDGMRSFGDSSVLIVEGGANRLSKIDIEGANGAVTTVGEGYSGPVAVTVVGEKAYVLEGQFSQMQAGPDAEAPPIYAVGVDVGAP
jgi:outer membrane protein assembly factor BamB